MGWKFLNIKDGDTALVLASITGHLEVVKYLVSKGANVNTKDTSLKTPLEIAKEKGHLEVVRVLREAGARE